MFIQTDEAAATLLVGVDALRNNPRKTSTKPRWMRGIGVIGGNAVNECTIELFIEDFFVGTFQNTKNGVVALDMAADVKPVGPHYVPPGSPITALIRIAPTVSPLMITII